MGGLYEGSEGASKEGKDRRKPLMDGDIERQSKGWKGGMEGKEWRRDRASETGREGGRGRGRAGARVEAGLG